MSASSCCCHVSETSAWVRSNFAVRRSCRPVEAHFVSDNERDAEYMGRFERPSSFGREASIAGRRPRRLRRRTGRSPLFCARPPFPPTPTSSRPSHRSQMTFSIPYRSAMDPVWLRQQPDVLDKLKRASASWSELRAARRSRDTLRTHVCRPSSIRARLRIWVEAG